MLHCENVSKDFGGLRALSRVSLSVNAGEIVGLVGPNGSGKSTLINVISGQYAPTAGQITFEGHKIAAREPHVITQLGIARTYQIPRPFATMTTLENVAIGCLFGRNMEVYGQADRVAGRWLDFTGLARFANTAVGQLNLHQRKFLELARALACEPQLILLDEVLAGLNDSEIEDSIAMIRKIRERGITIIIVEHNMRAVISLSERIVVLDQGSLIADGPPHQVMRDPVVVSAYLGKEYA
jgi:branched-chain amino acid transport system permease protein